MKFMTGKVLVLLFCVLGVVVSDGPFTPKGKGPNVVAQVVTMIDEHGIFPDDNKFLCRVAWVESKYGTNSRTYRPFYYGGIWQVDQIGWLDTVQRPSLRKYHQRIKDVFKIDWTKTSWADLQKPFYSGLAARLLLATVPAAIPPSYDLEAQGQYWKKYYNRSGAGTAEKFVSDVRQAYGCAV
ncbi:uncharacterized protein LOC116304268 [Actinia tenebrosa]|uniref:Uncharacterized protein LOC116304268 n=1 Tax=Actinia tenebrosa TaxID=6105 RepID=A0A6P8IUI2_ACTTE|nr:uncharacterized protein LOC116304268 [Actinia tenebrosa]XP_031569835.1 uncharacterized protein LOC116304268 [Actinia tenebrosa]XP_031569836.1 uncharacterized protein LOC116304268 [Actinia tenebrosa]